MGDGLWSEAELYTQKADLDISQINFVERVLIGGGPQCLCQLDRPILYLVCWKDSVYMRPREVFGVSP
jgi:hypothetical protein